jgi:nucleoside phosphorylase
VLCTGSKGKDATTAAVDFANRLLLLPQKHWIVVGICATTDDACPIGTVLVSTGAIYNVNRTHSQGFETEDTITPTPFVTRATLEMTALFRRPPEHDAEPVAKPRRVPVKAVPFACTNEVINMKADRDALQTHLCSTLPAMVHFGIEMEGTGIASFGQSPVAVIKSVSDYSDERKSDWPPGVKTLFQLYAAETAAEYVAQALRES